MSCPDSSQALNPRPCLEGPSTARQDLMVGGEIQRSHPDIVKLSSSPEMQCRQPLSQRDFATGGYGVLQPPAHWARLVTASVVICWAEAGAVRLAMLISPRLADDRHWAVLHFASRQRSLFT